MFDRNHILLRSLDVPGHMTSDELGRIIDIVSAYKDQGPISYLEVGTLIGRSLMAVGLALPSHSTLVSVDIANFLNKRAGCHVSDIYAEIVSNRPDLKLSVFRGDSIAARKIYHCKFTLAFIDGGHDLQSVQDDITTWHPQISEGGMIFGHDYCKHFPDVTQAVDEYFTKLGGIKNNTGSIWEFRRQPAA
jgi:predicted O-methyltransferase YrrM